MASEAAVLLRRRRADFIKAGRALRPLRSTDQCYGLLSGIMKGQAMKPRSGGVRDDTQDDHWSRSGQTHFSSLYCELQGYAQNRSCTSILRIIPPPEKRVVYHRFPIWKGQRPGRRPAFPRPPAPGAAMAVRHLSLGVARHGLALWPHSWQTHSAGSEACDRPEAVSGAYHKAPLCRLCTRRPGTRGRAISLPATADDLYAWPPASGGHRAPVLP